MKLSLTDGGTAQTLDLDDYPDLGGVGQTVLVQNLGPGAVWFDRDSGVDETTGVKIATDGYWEFASVAEMYFMADGGNADLRVTVVG